MTEHDKIKPLFGMTWEEYLESQDRHYALIDLAEQLGVSINQLVPKLRKMQSRIKAKEKYIDALESFLGKLPRNMLN